MFQSKKVVKKLKLIIINYLQTSIRFKINFIFCFLSFQDDGDYGKYGDDYSEEDNNGSEIEESGSDLEGDLEGADSDLDPEDDRKIEDNDDDDEEITSEEGMQKIRTKFALT